MEIYNDNSHSVRVVSTHIVYFTCKEYFQKVYVRLWTASLLLTYDEHDGRGDCAQYDHVVYGHPHQAGVVDLSHLLRTGLVRKEEAKNELQALVRVNNA